MDRDLSNFRPSRIWRRLPLDRRIDAAGLFWDDEQAADQQLEAVSSIATHMKFRPRSVLSLGPEKRAKYLAQLPTISDAIAARALVSYHLERQRPMMAAFLNLLAIPHDDGLIKEDTVPKPDAAAVTKAATDLAATFPPDQAGIYLSTLVSQDPEAWDALADAPETQSA